jgi:hypothetical protein
VRVEEFADDDVGLEADGMRVGANEGAAKNALGPARKIVPLQGFEERELDLRLLRDRREGYLLFFTPLAQSSAKTLWHAAHLAGLRHTRPDTLFPPHFPRH